MVGNGTYGQVYKVRLMVQKCDCLLWVPSGGVEEVGSRSGDLRGYERLQRLEPCEREKEERRIKVIREGSSKKWNVFAGL